MISDTTYEKRIPTTMGVIAAQVKFIAAATGDASLETGEVAEKSTRQFFRHN